MFTEFCCISELGLCVKKLNDKLNLYIHVYVFVYTSLTSNLQAKNNEAAPTSCKTSFVTICFDKYVSTSLTARYKVSWFSSKFSCTSTSQSTKIDLMLVVSDGWLSMYIGTMNFSWNRYESFWLNGFIR